MRTAAHPNRSAVRQPITSLFLAGLAISLSACATTGPADRIEAELARLREEHAALEQELAALRTEIQRLSGIETAAAPTQPAPAVVERRMVEPQPVERPEDPAAGMQIAAVLDTYRQALESEDMQRVREEVYGGQLPVEDFRYHRIWFDRTDHLKVELNPRSIDVRDGTADALVRQTMSFRLSRTNEQRRVRLDLRMAFERQGDRWRVSHVQPRR